MKKNPLDVKTLMVKTDKATLDEWENGAERIQEALVEQYAEATKASSVAMEEEEDARDS